MPLARTTAATLIIAAALSAAGCKTDTPDCRDDPAYSHPTTCQQAPPPYAQWNGDTYGQGGSYGNPGLVPGNPGTPGGVYSPGVAPVGPAG